MKLVYAFSSESRCDIAEPLGSEERGRDTCMPYILHSIAFSDEVTWTRNVRVKIH